MLSIALVLMMESRPGGRVLAKYRLCGFFSCYSCVSLHSLSPHPPFQGLAFSSCPVPKESGSASSLTAW